MDPEQQQTENKETEPQPAPQSGDSSAPPREGNGRRRHGRGGRGRFKRGDRGGGGRGDRGDRGPRPDENRQSSEPSRKFSGSIGDAIGHVEHIRAELARILDEMHEVQQILDQVEREQTASEVEIEKLREALHSIHRGPSYSRSPRPVSPAPAPAASEAPLSEPQDDDSAD